MEDIWEEFQSLLEALRNFKLALRKNKLACRPGQFPGLEDLEEYTPPDPDEPRAARPLWDRLVEEGNLALINKLNMVERGETGFSTVVVPAEGFSEDDETHNDVLAWLRRRGINICNPGLEIARMERALHGKVIS